MDERLKLTDEQMQIVERLRKTFAEELEKNNIELIHQPETNRLYFFNKQDVDCWYWPDGELMDDEYEMKLDDCEQFDLGAIALSYGDNSLYITFTE